MTPPSTPSSSSPTAASTPGSTATAVTAPGSPPVRPWSWGPLALTRMACPPGSLHDRIVKHWSSIRSYVLKDGHLHRALLADGGIYEYEPSSDAAPAGGATLEGTASYRERMALPPGAVFEAQLEDVSRADAAAEVIGKTSLPSPGNPPIRFAIGYDPARIQDGHSDRK